MTLKRQPGSSRESPEVSHATGDAKVCAADFDKGRVSRRKGEEREAEGKEEERTGRAVCNDNEQNVDSQRHS